MFSTGFARYLLTLAVAPEVEPVTVSPVIQPLFDDMNNLLFAIISSDKTVEVAPEVEPVMISPFVNDPPKVFSSFTSLLFASNPFLFVWLSNTKLSVVPTVSKSIWSIAVNVSKFYSADSMNRK